MRLSVATTTLPGRSRVPGSRIAGYPPHSHLKVRGPPGDAWDSSNQSLPHPSVGGSLFKEKLGETGSLFGEKQQQSSSGLSAIMILPMEIEVRARYRQPFRLIGIGKAIHMCRQIRSTFGVLKDDGLPAVRTAVTTLPPRRGGIVDARRLFPRGLYHRVHLDLRNRDETAHDGLEMRELSRGGELARRQTARRWVRLPRPCRFCGAPISHTPPRGFRLRSCR